MAKRQCNGKTVSREWEASGADTFTIHGNPVLSLINDMDTRDRRNVKYVRRSENIEARKERKAAKVMNKP
jgi:hypothetical protein